MKWWVWGIGMILALNIALNLWTVRFNGWMPLSREYDWSHHYYQDGRRQGGEFNLLRAWGQTDSQWYLKIAAAGYGDPVGLDIRDKGMQGLSYAFFPLWPILIRGMSWVTGGNFELAAFGLVNIIMACCWISIYWVVEKVYGRLWAGKTATLLLVYPFSLFLRSYHTEGLYLLELTWWLYFLTTRKMTAAAVVLAGLNITKGTGWILNGIFCWYLLEEVVKRRIRLIEAAGLVFVAMATILGWITYVGMKTGNVWYFYQAVKQWEMANNSPIIYNLRALLFGALGVVDGRWITTVQWGIFVLAVWLLVKSKKWLKSEWWLTAFALLIVPTLTTYSLGYTTGRLSILLLPLWVYGVSRLKEWQWVAAVVVFTAGLFLGAIDFVNWNWWG